MPATEPPGGHPVLAVETPQEWDAWIAAEPETSRGVWLKLAKKSSALVGVTYAEALEVALRHGWIDGQKYPGDDQYWLQRFCPRGPRSRWSKINRAAAEGLIESGRMLPAGQRQVELARSDGRWEAAYDGPRTATEPDDLRAALDADPAARAFFEKLSSANRYAILYRIHEAKRPVTRASRIEKFVAMCASGETFHPQSAGRPDPK